MSRSLLILGGARSGKSRHGQSWAEAHAGSLAYVATAQALDAEMAERIARHRAERDARWMTIEAPLDLPGAIAATGGHHGAILVDCLTLWLSNLMLGEHDIPAATAALIAALAACPTPIALIANEVGFGIVPDNALARRFRDEAGRLNQRLAQVVDAAVLVVAGLPLTLKGA